MRNITDALEKGSGTTDESANVRASRSILSGLLPDLDAVIQKGAPKYSDYMKQWSDLSKPIDAMEFLQKYQTGPRKLTNGTGYLQFNKVQKLLDDIYQGQKANGAHPANSLSDEHIQNIVNVRNELAADDLKNRMAAVRGSDTMQQLQQAGRTGTGTVGQVLKGAAGDLAVHTGIAAFAPGVGNAAYHFGVKPIMGAVKAARSAKAEQMNAAIISARKNALLNGGGNGSGNPLSP
jgi:hypothetical protein